MKPPRMFNFLNRVRGNTNVYQNSVFDVIKMNRDEKKYFLRLSCSLVQIYLRRFLSFSIDT